MSLGGHTDEPSACRLETPASQEGLGRPLRWYKNVWRWQQQQQQHGTRKELLEEVVRLPQHVLVSLISRTVLFNKHWENSLFSQCSLRSDTPPAISVSGVKHANKPALIHSDLISFAGCGTWTCFFMHGVQEKCTAAQRVSSRSQSTTLDLGRETRHPGGHATAHPNEHTT